MRTVLISKPKSSFGLGAKLSEAAEAQTVRFREEGIILHKCLLFGKCLQKVPGVV